MKKHNLLAIIGLVLLIMAACSKNIQFDKFSENSRHQEAEMTISNYEYEITTSSAFEDLNQELLLLNQIYPSEVPNRGRFWNWFKRIVLGDVLGACAGTAITFSPIGAIVFGILGSINGYLYEYHQEYGPTSYPSEPTVSPNMNMASMQSAINAGYVHNMVIYEIFDTYGDEIYEMSDAVLCDKIISHCRQYIPVPINIETSLRTNTTSKVLLNNAMRDYGIISSEVILNGFSHTYPSISDELETLSIFCDHYTGLLNQDTRDSYTTSFISTVNASAIPIASKDFLIASISTANYSTKLWVDNQ